MDGTNADIPDHRGADIRQDTESRHRPALRLGYRVYGCAAIWLGGVGLAWGDFAQLWQPFPDDFAARAPLAYAVALLLVACGVAVQFARSRRIAALTLAAIYAVFGALWIRRVVAMPWAFGTWSGVAEQWATAVGGMLLYLRDETGQTAQRGMRALIALFGAFAIMFGFNHFFALPPTAAMVPDWIPPNRMFWAVATGVADVLAGVAIIARVRDRLAAGLLAAMFLSFGLLVWLPILIGKPADHVAWAGNGVNLALTAAAWIVAETLGGRHASASPTISQRISETAS